MFQAITWRMAQRVLLVACALASGHALAQGTLLRVACDDDNAGAEVSINGVFKGECPLDMRVPAGTVKLEAVRKVDAQRERAFTQEFRVGDGVTKHIDIVLGPVQLNAEGRRLAAEKQRQEQQAREQAEQARQAALAAAAQARQQRIDDALAEFKTQGAEPGNGHAARECLDCPEMVLVPGTADQPPLAVGKYEVTVGEYAAFARESVPAPGQGCTVWQGGWLTNIYELWKLHPELGWEKPGFAQTPRHPVVCVSLSDAGAYARWLSRKTGHVYVVPTLADWVRANGQTRQTVGKPWKPQENSNHPACRFGNFYDLNADSELSTGLGKPYDCRDGFVYTAPVGSFPANNLGIHDLWGNAAELGAEIETMKVNNADYRYATAFGLSWAASGEYSTGNALSYDTYLDVNSGRRQNVGFRIVRRLEEAGTTSPAQPAAKASSLANTDRPAAPRATPGNAPMTEPESADRATRTVPAPPRLDPERLVSLKVRADIAKLRALVPPAQGARAASLTLVSRNADGERIRTVTVRRQGDLCVHDYAGGPTLIYHSAGLLVAGSNQAMRFIDERVVTVEQHYEGNIATLSPGQTLLAELNNRSLPGETRVTVQDTRPTWPEYGFAGAATRLKVVRDFETRGGYYTAEEAMLYSPEVGCALPVAENVLDIGGNKLFGNKNRASTTARDIVLQD